MDGLRWKEYRRLCSDFRSRVETWTGDWPGLLEDEVSVAKASGYDYPVQTPIVYNRALDEFSASERISIVLVADNPGMNEQLEENRRYLVGQSGKLAAGFFKRELGMDFRREVAILNKCPVHTPKTKDLAKLPARYAPLLAESQEYMASLAFDMAKVLGAELWVSGYSELGERGIFSGFSRALRERYAKAAPGGEAPGARAAKGTGDVPPCLVFRHFSMNQFANDYRARKLEGEAPRDALSRIGALYRAEKLGISQVQEGVAATRA